MAGSLFGLLRFRLSLRAFSVDPAFARGPLYLSVRQLTSPAASEPAEPAESGGEAERRTPWTPQSRRTGAIAVKLGMTQMWNDEGHPVPVTALQVRIYVDSRD